MVDLSATLQQFQDALSAKYIKPGKCESSQNLYKLVDDADGKNRITYTRIIKDEVHALVAFVPVDPYKSCHCLNVGYAVNANMRNQGIGSEFLEEAFLDLQEGITRSSLSEYYVEAIVGVNNLASNRIANKYISDKPKQIVCQVSGEDAYQYLRRFESKQNET